MTNETVRDVCLRMLKPASTCKACDFVRCPMLVKFSAEVKAAHEREMLALRTSLRELVEMHEICDYGCDRCKFNENCEEVESDIVKRAKAALGKASGEDVCNGGQGVLR